MNTTIILAAKMIAAISVFAGFFYVSQIAVDPDLWWHLKVGERILGTQTVPHFDEYSFTMPGHRWVDHEWLVDGWFWWMRVHGLWLVVGVIFSALASIPFFFWIKRSRSFLGLAIILIAAIFTTNIVGIRPQMITFALFFVLFEIIRLRFEKNRNYFWLLPPIFLIWANLHGGFLVGLAFMGFCVFAHYAYLFFKKMRINFSDVRSDILIILTSVLVTFINPYGIEIYHELYRVLLSANTAKYISEWQPALSTYLFSSVVIIAIFIAFGLARDFRRVYSTSLFLGAVFVFALFLKSVRHGVFFLIGAMPFILLSADKVENIVFSSPDRRFKDRMAIVVSIILFISFAAFSYRIYRTENYPYPAAAVEFIKKEVKNSGQIRIFNNYGWGGYLIFHAPEIKVFIDGRMPHWAGEYGEGAMKDSVKVRFGQDQNAWQEVFKRRQINMVLAASDEAAEKGLRAKWRKKLLANVYIKKLYNLVVKEESFDLKQTLQENGWRVRYEDDVSVIFTCGDKDCYGN